MKSPSSFVAITSEGGLLPADFLHQLPDPKTSIEGVTPVAYHLAEGERLNEQINRSWNRLKGCWENFKKAIAQKPTGEPTTTETRERWLHPIFQELGFGQRLAVAPPIEVDGRSYPVSHAWTHVPIHLVGSHVDLDRRTPGAVGAAKASPHSLVQQALNASEGHLWGIVTNGLNFRLLRDSIALTRLSYVEWDLAAIFDGDLYSEFFLLWLVCHQSRFEDERADGGQPHACWLEKWKKTAEDKGLRALQELRPGVARAIEALGAGLVSHPANKALCARLRSGELSTQEFYRQVLRVIYRMLFLFVAEDRDLLHPPLPGATASKEEIDQAHRARSRYRDYYAITRLRGLTLHRAGTPHPDLWFIFQLLTQKLGSDTGCPELALPALGSFLWDADRSTPDLANTLVSNRQLLTAVHALAFVQDGSVRRPIDYKNLGSEELGSVYEGLLELHPLINADSGVFQLNIAVGNERKTSGSYYTPDSLVQCLLDSALEPVMADAVRGKEGEAAANALLKLKVCDPAVGSGHFLIGAAHRLAKRVAAARSDEEEPSPEATRTALRDVIGRCLYGVDINPMSAELCRVSLWLEALEPGKPLSFLDHHIRVGNSLLGTTPELISAGLSDDTFEAIEGDDKAACASLKKLNRAQREGMRHMFIAEDTAIRERMYQAAAAIDDISDSKPEDIHRKETAFRNAQSDYDFQKAWDLANLWCAAFVIKKHPPVSATQSSNLKSEITATLDSQPLATQGGLFGGTEELPKTKGKKAKAPSRADTENAVGITTQHLRDFVESGELPDGLLVEVKRLADHYQFFHWHLAFPEVFAQGGFDLGFGNPPWDALSPDAREFFSLYNEQVRFEDREGQKRIIDELLINPTIAARWEANCRDLYALVHFIKQSGRYRLFAPGNLGKGDFNVFRMFVEVTVAHTRKGGWAAQIVPEGLYNGANCAAIRRALFEECRLDCFLGFENANEVWFPDVDTRMKFCLYAAQVGDTTSSFRTAFNIRSTESIADVKGGVWLRMPVQLVKTFSPDAFAIMELASQQEIDITEKMYRHPAFGDSTAGPPHRDYSAEIHMGNNRDLFGNDPDGIPLCEGRMVGQYDHRAKGYCEGRGRAADWANLPFTKTGKVCQPQWFISPDSVPAKLDGRPFEYRACFCAVVSPTNERTLAAALIPPRTLCGHSVPTILFEPPGHAWYYPFWIAVANSYAMDFIVRMKVALNLTNTVMDSMPFPRPQASETPVRRIVDRSLRLLCTGPEMIPFWNKLAAEGWVTATGPDEIPGELDEDKRLQLRAEIDTIVARDVFGLTRSELEYILTTFPTQQRYQEEQYGEFRSRRLILEAFEHAPKQSAIPTPAWLDRPLVLPTSRRIGLTPDRYRAAVVPHLLYQAGGSVSFDRFRKAYWLLTEPKRLERYASGTVGEIARGWARTFRDKLEKDCFIAHLKGAVGRQLHFIQKDQERWLELRDANVANDEFVIFDARLALLVAELWPETEPITPLAPTEEITIQELEAVL